MTVPGGPAIRTIEITDLDAMRQWYAVMEAAEREAPLYLWPSFETAIRIWSAPDPHYTNVFRLAEVDGVAVGAARSTYPLQDNLHVALDKVFVAPDHRRQGVGTALVETLEDEALERGRGTVLMDVGHPPGQPGPGARFAEALGYAIASREVLKAADLASTSDRWPALAAHAEERLDGYRLVSWTDETPEKHLDSLAVLFTRFLGEIPLEDVDLKPQVWDGDRIRANEARRRDAGTRALLVAAVAPDGSLAGYTNLAVQVGNTYAGIDSTLVLPEHRGHRLGLAMKVRLHQLTAELLPEVVFIYTQNAGVNRWMNDVNADLGYVDVEESLDLQKKLAAPTPGSAPEPIPGGTA